MYIHSCSSAISSSAYVNLQQIAEPRFAADIWISKVNSHMLFLAASTIHAEGLHEGAQTFAQDTGMEGLLSAPPQARLGTVWHQGEVARYKAEGICQKGGGEMSHAQLGGAMRAARLSSQPTALPLMHTGAGMVSLHRCAQERLILNQEL